MHAGFPRSSAGKESACNAGDPVQFNSWVGKTPGEGIGYPLQYSWAALVAQTVKNLQGRRPGFNSWVGKIPWRRAWQPTLVFLPGEFHGQRSLEGYSPGVAKSRTWLKQLSTAQHMTAFVLSPAWTTAVFSSHFPLPRCLTFALWPILSSSGRFCLCHSLRTIALTLSSASNPTSLSKTSKHFTTMSQTTLNLSSVNHSSGQT